MGALLADGGPPRVPAHGRRATSRGRARRCGATGRPARSGRSGPVDEDEKNALETVLRQLPLEQREVVHLKVYDGWTFQRIADWQGVSIHTAASRYRYAIATMRERLRDNDIAERTSS